MRRKKHFESAFQKLLGFFYIWEKEKKASIKTNNKSKIFST